MTTDFVDVAFVVPGSGPSGIYGPACEASGQFAAVELNQAGGILGREVRLHAVDGGRPPHVVARDVAKLVDSGAVDVVVGWHTSAVRKALAHELRARIPYMYTAVYEGGEHTPGLFLTGETPDGQLLPGLRWMAEELGVRRWIVVGSDYIWPRETARVVRAYADACGLAIAEEVFAPLGTEDFGGILRRDSSEGRSLRCSGRPHAATGIRCGAIQSGVLRELGP